MRIRLATVLVFLLLAILATNCSPAAVQNAGTANPKPSIIALDASPAEVTRGSAATLSWNVSGATKVAFDQNIGDVPATGKISVTPDTTTTYSLAASNNSGSVSQSVTVKVNPANPVSQSVPATSPSANAAPNMQKSQSFCRDGECTFYNGKLYSIDYPDTWKISNLNSEDLSTVRLLPIDIRDQSIEIAIMDPIGAMPVEQVADQYVKDFLSHGDNSYYIADRGAVTQGPWDWFVDSYYGVGTSFQHILVYYKSTDSHLYRLRAFAVQYGYQVRYPFSSDFDKIINSFKLLQ